MKNKNALYIVLGIGAGVVAYYLFCKKKNEEKASGEPDAKAEDKPTPSKAVAGGFGGGSVISAPAMPKFVTPIATTTPLVVNVTSTPSTTPVIASATPSRSDATITSSPVTSPVSSPVTSPVIASTTPSRSDLTTLSSDVTKPATSPITTPTTTTATTTTATATTPLKTSSFEGIGQQCFEVGECLYDL